MLVLAGLVLLGCRRAPEPRPPDDARTSGTAVPEPASRSPAVPEPASRPPAVPEPTGETPGDLDGDGIPDPDDRCPENPETLNYYEDRDGCPDEIPTQIAEFLGTLVGIEFGPRSDTLAKAQHKALDAALKILRQYPLLQVEIRGHTATGEPPELSLTRARNVRTYLIERGVAPDRLLVSGAADEEPSDLSGTPAGQAKNRRVEFKPQIE